MFGNYNFFETKLNKYKKSFYDNSISEKYIRFFFQCHKSATDDKLSATV